MVSFRVKNIKEPLEKQAALMYNLLRKVIGIGFPMSPQWKMIIRISILTFDG